MATSPSGTPSRPNEPPPNNSFSSSSSPPELSPPSPPASSSSSSPPVSSQPHPSPPFSPPPTPPAPPPTASSSPAPPRSQSTPPQSPPPLPSLPSPAPPQSPAPTRTPDAVPIPSTPSPPSQSEPRNTTPDATGNSNPPTVFLPPPAVPAGGPPAPPATRSPPSSAPSRPSSSPPNSGNAPSSSVNNNAIIVAGIFVAAILLLSVVVFCLMCPRKKKKQPYYMDATRPPPAMGGDQQYVNGSTEWLNNPQFLHIPSQAAAGGWAAVPPHSPGNLSSEYSAGFSPLPASPPGMGGFNQSEFSYEELAAATAGFSQANLLGQGGFGYVHKGVLTTGKEVAVKSLKTGSGQGEREFQAEVEIISRVHHRHLVSLVGYCIGQGQRMLVYEFVPNQTLEFHLHGKGQPVMDWPTRLKIAVGSAKGLAYLHEDCHPRIIHRDIKTANILLDEKFEAMVADFGLAKLSTDNNTHVSTRVMGTFGYLAPEYASSGKLTEKSDVFSYGVMLLELITGRRPVDNNNYEEDSLVDWARPLLAKALEDGNYAPLADVRLEGNFDQDEMSRMAACAAASIRHSAKRRPKMSQIMHVLEGNSSLESLNDNLKAVQSAVVGGDANDTRLYDTIAYNADMMKFREMVMSSPEFNSSEYGGNADENGLDPASSSSSNSDSTEHYGYQVHNHNKV